MNQILNDYIDLKKNLYPRSISHNKPNIRHNPKPLLQKQY